MPQILVNDDVNDDDLVVRPAQCDGALTQRILTRGAFAMRQDLLQRALAHIEAGQTTQLLCGDLMRHDVSPPPAGQRQLP